LLYSVKYVTYPRQEIDVTLFHCRRCHRTAYIRDYRAPLQCTNKGGYIDQNDIFHKPCGSSRWHIWPDDFDPATTTCEHCLNIWQQEQLDPSKKQVPKRRGPKPKRRLVDTEE
jgi:hypothetical protein